MFHVVKQCHGPGPAITFIQLWEQDLFENWDDHLPETVSLDQTTYPFKYDVKGTANGDEFPSTLYDFYLWAEHNCTSDRHTTRNKIYSFSWSTSQTSIGLGVSFRQTD
ncbi:hypothetical protein GCK72_022079 [Caenorhabditis remanei]|nr:hypothetical protein GCK72_022079 [Caenorhabditis remanei]KAF1745632.1 hypothetical protein GCK72_022079 [Caenorhabditis remanei]